MRTLRTLFWVVLAVLIALFSYSNWTTVTINVTSDFLMDVKLPVVVVFSFLLGLTPMWLLHRISRWTMRRKLDSAERALASVKPVMPPPSVSTSADFSSTQGEP